MEPQSSNSSTSIAGCFAELNGQATQHSNQNSQTNSTSTKRRRVGHSTTSHLDDNEDEISDSEEPMSTSDTSSSKFPSPFDSYSNWPSMGSGNHSNTSLKHDNWIYVLTGAIIDMRNKFNTFKREAEESQKLLVNRVTQLEAAIAEKAATIGELNRKILALEKPNSINDTILAEIKSAAKDAVEQLPPLTSFADMVSYGTRKDRTSLEVDIVYATSKETIEKEKRAANLIIYGLAQNENAQVDQNNLKSLLNVIKVDTSAVKRSTRLKSGNTTKPPPILVELANPNERKKALDNSRELRNRPDYANVSISPDMTVAERLVKKKLLDKCRSMNTELPTNSQFTYKLRNNSIMKIDRTSNKIFKPNGSSGSISS